MKSAAQLEKKIERTREQLHRLENELHKVRRRSAQETTQEEMLNRLEIQFKRKYPNVQIDTELLSLVGTLPKFPRSNEKRIIRDAVAEKYG